MIPVLNSGISPLHSGHVSNSKFPAVLVVGVVAPDYETDFSTSTGWTLDTDMSISTGKLRGISLDLDQTYRASHSVNTTLSDTTWYVRAGQFNVADITTARGMIGLSLTDSTGITTAGDSVVWYLHDTVGTLVSEWQSYDGGVQDNTGIGGDLVYTTDYWMDIARVSATSIRIRIYSDSGYTTQVGSDLTGTILSTIVSLVNVQTGSLPAGNAGDKANYTLTDLTVWNNVTEKP